MWPNFPVIQIICVAISNWRRSALVDTSRGWTIPCDNFCLPLFRLSFPIFMLDNWSMPGSTKNLDSQIHCYTFLLVLYGFSCIKMFQNNMLQLSFYQLNGCSFYMSGIYVEVFWCHFDTLLSSCLAGYESAVYCCVTDSFSQYVCLWNKNIQMLVAPTLFCFIFHKVLLQILTVYLL